MKIIKFRKENTQIRSQLSNLDSGLISIGEYLKVRGKRVFRLVMPAVNRIIN